LINEFQSRQADFDKEIDKLANLCKGAVSEARKAIAEAIASLRKHNETAGQWIARSDLWFPGDIPGTSQEARNALSKLSSEMDKLRKCSENPPPPPPIEPPSPGGPHPEALKAQQDLIRRREMLYAQGMFEGDLKSILELGGKIDHELEKAKVLARRIAR
jgi:hypothetical protein